ncbi:MAG: VWA domain-containing protein [Verrucomicrobiota bacterium]
MTPTVSDFIFKNPEWFWLALLLPIWIYLRGRKGRNAALSFSSVALAKEVSKGSRSRVGGFFFFARLLAVLLVLTALARPQLGSGHSEIESSGIDIVLAIDVSGSMNALDFASREELATRLEIVKRAVTEFIERRPNDRIGLIAFAKESFLVSPLTLNHQWLLQNLDRIETGLIDGTQTAIGPAIGMSVNRLRDLPAESRIVVLLTDGEDNVNQVPPIAAAEAAGTFGVKIYTIAAGRSGRVPMPAVDRNDRIIRRPNGDPVFQGYAESRVDEETLQEIARITDGRFYRATDTEELKAIYEEIDRLETTEVKLRHYSQFDELYIWPLIAASVIFGIELILSNTRFRSLP